MLKKEGSFYIDKNGRAVYIDNKNSLDVVFLFIRLCLKRLKDNIKQIRGNI